MHVTKPKADQVGWYVIQVRSGAEERMCCKITRACEEHDNAANDPYDQVGLQECFSPRFRTQRKWKGEWQGVEHLLLPGYVIAVVRNPKQLVVALRTISEFGKLLTSGEMYAPLDESDRSWMEHWTGEDERVIPMSFAHKVGDELEVSEGPLKGFAGKIVKVDRRNSLAHVEFHVGQMTIKTKVGLGIVPTSHDG